MKKYDNEQSKNKGKKGIVGLARERQKYILMDDIEEHKQDDSEEWKEYIEFKQATQTQLSVPIVYDRDDNTATKEVLGVINLEYSQPYVFQDYHKKVVEIFAKQIAIAYQKKNLVNSIANNNKILENLHQSLNKITQKSSESMLYEAVAQTRESFSAQKVIVIPIKKIKVRYLDSIKEELKIVAAEIVPRYESWIEVLYDESKKVYQEDEDKVYQENKDKILELVNLKNSYKKEFRTGFCMPFSSGKDKEDKMGVMWILFAKSIDTEQLEKNQEIYRVYANQIALAYANSKKFEELKTKDSKSLANVIKRDHLLVFSQAIIWFLLSVCSSSVGLYLIFNSYSFQGEQDIKNTAIGLLLQGITVLAINQGIKANKRMDEYHQESYNTNQLNILLSATEEFNPEIMQEEKQKIIRTTTKQWLKLTNEDGDEFDF